MSNLTHTIRSVGNLILIDEDTGDLLDWVHNDITEAHKEGYASWLAGETIDPPNYIAVGNVGALPTETLAQFSALKSEMDRAELAGRSRQTAIVARLLGVFQLGRGVGEINEFGLFGSAADVDEVDDCDSDTDWSSDNTLAVDTEVFREGTGSLKAEGSGDISFENDSLGLGDIGATVNSYLQFWYYIDDASNLGTDGLTIELSSSTTNKQDAYRWVIATDDLDDDWTWMNLLIDDATVVGTPDLDAFVRLTIYCESKTASVVERIDKVRIFNKSGVLWARAEPNSTITKAFTQVLGVYWFFSAREGATSVNLNAFAKESVTVGTTATQLTESVFKIPGEEGAKLAEILVTKAPVRMLLTGDDPTETEGILLTKMSLITIDNQADIENARFIRDEGASEDAVLEVQYSR